MFEPYAGATGKINNAVKEVIKDQEQVEEEGEEEQGEYGEEEYSGNFEDAQSPDELDTEQTEEPQRPSAPVCWTQWWNSAHSLKEHNRNLFRCLALDILEKIEIVSKEFQRAESAALLIIYCSGNCLLLAKFFSFSSAIA